MELFTLEDVLLSKENRTHSINKQLKMIDKPILSFTCNVPGKKNNEWYQYIYQQGQKTILNYIKDRNISILKTLNYQDSIENNLIMTLDYDPIVLKEISIQIEQTEYIGRLWDIDILSNIDGLATPIHRTELKLPERTCFLCSKSAKICYRERKHSLEDIQKYIFDTVEKYKGISEIKKRF